MTKTRTLALSTVLAILLALAGLAWVASTGVADAGYAQVQHAAVGQAHETALTSQSSFAPGVVLVGLKESESLSPGVLGAGGDGDSLSAILAGVGAQGMERVFPGLETHLRIGAVASGPDEVDLGQIYRIRVPLETDIAGIIEQLNAHPDVLYAEPDYLAHLITTPNDPLYADQWGLEQIGAPGAWDVVTGTADVVIAVVDAGLDTTHPDLSGRLWTNPGEIPSNSVDDDNNGHVDDIHGWNVVDDNADLTDNTGHGTQVAGVAAAATDNSLGVAGVCWDCRVMVVKVVQPGGVANYSDIAAGVVYAAQKGAEVINVSLGAYSDSATLRAAVAAASETAVVVAGAGNDNTDQRFYPAAYDDYVLAVAGTTSSDTKMATSNYGAWVDVSAPGEVITTTVDGGGYGSASGTSMAAPFAAGLAGLLRSQYPAWSPDQVRAQVIHTAEPIDAVNPGYEGRLGSGRIDAAGAVTTAAQPDLKYESHTVNGEPAGRPERGTTVDLEVTLCNDWGDASNMQASLSTADIYATVTVPTASYGNILAYESGAGLAAFRFSVSSSAAYGHDIPFTLSVTADGGYARDIPLIITTASGITYVHGTLSTQTWTNDRLYVVDNDVGIQAGHTLTIEMGTEVRFAGNYSLSVAGTLIADGTDEQPIRFTSDETYPGAGDWGQIIFLDSSVDATFDGEGQYVGGSILRHTIVEYGEGVQLTSSAPFISRNAIAYVESPGLSASGSAGLVIVDNTFLYSGMSLTGLGNGCAITGNSLLRGGLGVSGPASVYSNSVAQAPGHGIVASGGAAVTRNRVVECGAGIEVNGGFVSGNLIANNRGEGLGVTGGTPAVVSNTVVFNGGPAVYIHSGTPTFHGNNLLAGDGEYSLRNGTSSGVDSTENWWGTADAGAIQAGIYDGDDEFGLGLVDYGGYMSNPAQDAPAYVSAVSLTPASPVGIETVTFDLTFSRPMDQSTDPTVFFYPSRRETWAVYNTSNSGLPDNDVLDIAVGADGSVWFATNGAGVARLKGGVWTVYNSSNSDLPADADEVWDIALDSDGALWFACWHGVVARFDGAMWTIYDAHNSPVPEGVQKIAIDRQGAKWIGTNYDGVLRFDGSTWKVYNPGNSGLPAKNVTDIAIDHDGSIWFVSYDGTHSRLVHFADGTWTTYDSGNSGLPEDWVSYAFVDSKGVRWFGTGAGVARFDGTTWAVYNSRNSGLPVDQIGVRASEPTGEVWFAGGAFDEACAVRFDGAEWTVFRPADSGLVVDHINDAAVASDGTVWLTTMSYGAAVLFGGRVHTVSDDASWLDDTHWRVTYDVNSLVARDDYDIEIGGARGADGLEIPNIRQFGFTVDYAGQITDQTPPLPPVVDAKGDRDDASYVHATWSASDPDSPITGYRYGIGSAPGVNDVVSWTPTTGTSMTRTGLGLANGNLYWVSVQARNSGGLWSTIGKDFFFAGRPVPKGLFPLTMKRCLLP